MIKEPNRSFSRHDIPEKHEEEVKLLSSRYKIYY